MLPSAAAHLTSASSPWPSSEMVATVLRHGLSAVRPIRDHISDGWLTGEIAAPSYRAYGRARFLVTLQHALTLRPRRVFEVAAGDGALSATLAAFGANCTANDLRADHLRESLSTMRTGEQVSIVEGNVFDLAPEPIYDLVVAAEIIEHVAHADDFLRHLRGFLAPGGRLLLTTPNGNEWCNKLPTFSQIDDLSALESQQFKPDADGHLFLFTRDELDKLARECGYAVESMQLWATPLLTGHGGLRLLGSVMPNALAWAAEKMPLPEKIRERSCFNIVAVFKN